MRVPIGKLDQRVALQRKTRTSDGSGGATVSWSTYATVWAHVRPMRGRERENAMREEAASDYIVVIRYRSGVVEGDRIEWRDRHMNVRFVRNEGPRTSMMEIESEMGAAS